MVQASTQQLLSSRTTGGEISVILRKDVIIMVPSPLVRKRWLLEEAPPTMRKFSQIIDSDIKLSERICLIFETNLNSATQSLRYGNWSTRTTKSLLHHWPLINTLLELLSFLSTSIFAKNKYQQAFL